MNAKPPFPVISTGRRPQPQLDTQRAALGIALARRGSELLQEPENAPLLPLKKPPHAEDLVLARKILKSFHGDPLPGDVIVFDYDHLHPMGDGVPGLLGKRGRLRLARLTVKVGSKHEQHLVAVGYTREGKALTHIQIIQMLRLPHHVVFPVHEVAARPLPLRELAALARLTADRQREVLMNVSQPDVERLHFEADALDSEAEKLNAQLAQHGKVWESRLKRARAELSAAATVDAKRHARARLHQLEGEHRAGRRRIVDALERITERRQTLIRDIEAVLAATVSVEEILTAKWRVELKEV